MIDHTSVRLAAVTYRTSYGRPKLGLARARPGLVSCRLVAHGQIRIADFSRAHFCHAFLRRSAVISAMPSTSLTACMRRAIYTTDDKPEGRYCFDFVRFALAAIALRRVYCRVVSVSSGRTGADTPARPSPAPGHARSSGCRPLHGLSERRGVRACRPAVRVSASC
ncbi:unnamed protein product (plasmid) [Mycetohabitans rhizoxinica HKI 454]|uniref:Uncharacterized protein n=1 Tax=Mycetohabitans rhizoxinica (strain DSM 19002 / CIP 109453 / HKI 454) TaxID=882378 RepID=E5AVX0_MYCRK|nr:unnamed protein product [Mycetohabitans rhizoxinica HKI 454]